MALNMEEHLDSSTDCNVQQQYEEFVLTCEYPWENEVQNVLSWTLFQSLYEQ